MLIRIWYPYFVFSCIVIPCFVAKPFSLNEAIAAEERQKHSLQITPRPKSSSEKPEKFFLNKIFKSNSSKSKKNKLSESILPKENKILSSLKYRNKSKIKNPLKPKKLKLIQKSRNKRKNQLLKRHVITDNEIYNRKHTPLLRSLSMLFDNILSANSNESYKVRRKKNRKNRNTSKRNNICTCAQISNTDEKSSKEAIVSSASIVEVATVTEPATTEAPTTTAYNTSSSDISSLRQYPDVPLLLTRDTLSTRRDDTGLSEGSGPSLYSSLERNIPGTHRNSEHYTGGGEGQSHAKNNEEDSSSYSRDGTSGNEFRRGLRGIANDKSSPVYRRGSDETQISKETEISHQFDRGNFNPVYRGGIEETQLSKEAEINRQLDRGNFNELERNDKFEIGRNETKGTELLPQFVRGDRRFVSEDSVNNYAEPLQPKESDKECFINDTLNIPVDQRLAIRNGTFTKETQETGETNPTVISITDFNNPIIMLQNSPKYKAPFVTIIDGYSVARDKNGSNKLAEQSIRIHSEKMNLH